MNKYFLLFFVLILFISCSKDVEKKSIIKQKSLDLHPVPGVLEHLRNLVLFATGFHAVVVFPAGRLR